MAASRPRDRPITGLHSPTTVSFDSNGGLLTPKTIATTYTVTTGATKDLTITIDLNNSTQFGNSFGVSSLSQDGYKPGTLSGLTVEADGTILGNFSNGQSRTMGQVLLTNFRNPNGLVSVGGNQWQWTPEAGAGWRRCPRDRHPRRAAVGRHRRVQRRPHLRAGQHDHPAARLPGQRPVDQDPGPDPADPGQPALSAEEPGTMDRLIYTAMTGASATMGQEAAVPTTWPTPPAPASRPSCTACARCRCRTR